VAASSGAGAAVVAGAAAVVAGAAAVVAGAAAVVAGAAAVVAGAAAVVAAGAAVVAGAAELSPVPSEPQAPASNVTERRIGASEKVRRGMKLPFVEFVFSPAQ